MHFNRYNKIQFQEILKNILTNKQPVNWLIPMQDVSFKRIVPLTNRLFVTSGQQNQLQTQPEEKPV